MTEDQVQSLHTPRNRYERRAHLLRLLLVVGFWVLLVGSGYFYLSVNNLTLTMALHGLIDYSSECWCGPLVFIAVAALCPLIFFPAALLGVAGGFLFGPVWGLVYTLLGCNLSATVSYTIGRSCGQSLHAAPRLRTLIERYSGWLRRNDFVAILTLRLAFLPYDLVNCLIGTLRLCWWRFMLANTLGSLPGALALVLFGTSIDHFDGRLPAFNPWVLAASLGFLAVSLTLARGLRCR
jgi:uncharacterized membrane protein YdjX (TVP38/TMEM64 family)